MKQMLKAFAVFLTLGLLLVARAPLVLAAVPLHISPPATWKPWVPQSAGNATVEQRGDVYIIRFQQSPTPVPVIPTSTVRPYDSGCFPNNAIWNWSDIFHLPPLQAWIGPQEIDSYGLHNNFHVGWFCGPDTRNYHIRYNGVTEGSYTWETYDSVTGETTLYEVWDGLSVDVASGVAGSQIANSAALAVGDSGLAEAALNILTDVCLALLLA